MFGKVLLYVQLFSSNNKTLRIPSYIFICDLIMTNIFSYKTYRPNRQSISPYNMSFNFSFVSSITYFIRQLGNYYFTTENPK